MVNEDKPKLRQPRLSIGKKYTQSGIVAELLTLLETATADGTISEEEARGLDEWLASNKKDSILAPLPGIEFLHTTVRQILEDGKVTPDEKTALYKAVERMLPPEARRLAKDRRGAKELLEKERQRAEKQAERESERLERERNRPVDSANFMVAGVLHEGRAEVVEHYVNEDDHVFLARDPGNPYDPNAIEVRLKNGYQIGFVPREDAATLAGFLDSGCTHLAYVTKILQGRRGPIPVVQSYLYLPEANVVGTVSQSEVPAKKQAPAPEHGQGCLGRAVLLVGLGGLIFILAAFAILR